jgi:hypothetical protein
MLRHPVAMTLLLASGQQLKQLASVDDFAVLIRLVEVFCVFGDNILGLGGNSAFIDAVVIFMLREF